jgi:hypothetical protein
LSGLCLLFASLAYAEDAKKTAEKPKNQFDTSNFIHIRRDAKKKPLALETSIVRYAAKDQKSDAATVDLVAAFHVGDKKYYDDLNAAFEKYDVVLYELVAPPGTKVPKGGAKNDSTLSKIQKFLKDTLALEFQLECIDYTKENFVHADMSAEDIAKSMEEKGETVFSIFSQLMSRSMEEQAKQNDDGGMELFFAFLSDDRALALKRAFANQLEKDDSLAVLDSVGSTLIRGRNAVALDVLRKQIEGGKKKIAIFYGAGHMPDFDKRLREDFKLEPDKPRWITAWAMESKPKPKKEQKKTEKKDGQKQKAASD